MGFIYKISNTINQKVYIGLTYRNITIRWREHKNRAINNYPGYLYNSMRKYGLSSFQIEQIDVGFDDLKEKEKYWINYYNSTNPANGYNLTLGGDGNLKINYREVYNLWDNNYSIKEISDELNIDRHTVKEILEQYQNYSEAEGLKRGTGRKAIPVNQYTIQGKYITTYISTAEASRLTNSNVTGISLCCNNKAQSANGYQWRYYNDNINDIKPIKKYCPFKRKVAQYDLNDNLIFIHDSLINAAKSLPNVVNYQSVANQIGQVCIGNRKSCRNYKWKYVNDLKSL